MGLSEIQAYINQYGLFFLALIIFIEYLNIPGFPAGIILPVAGMWVKESGANLLWALLISVASALMASWMLYYLGLKGGQLVLSKYLEKFPSHKPAIDKSMDFVERKGFVGVFLAKLIPTVRTIVSIPAGVLKMNFIKYTVSSCIGISIWNFALMLPGYLLGDEVLTMLS